MLVTMSMKQKANLVWAVHEEQKLVKNEELYKYANQTIEKLWKMVVEIFENSYKEK